MRLYAKLLLMILVTAGLQRMAPPPQWGEEMWFAVRCYVAQVRGDEKLAGDLLEEFYRRKRTVDDDAADAIQIELCLLADRGSASTASDLADELDDADPLAETADGGAAREDGGRSKSADRDCRQPRRF